MKTGSKSIELDIDKLLKGGYKSQIKKTQVKGVKGEIKMKNIPDKKNDKNRENNIPNTQNK